MRYNLSLLIIVAMLLFSGVVMADQRWTRQESSYQVQKVQVMVEPQDGASLNSLNQPLMVPMIAALEMYQTEPLQSSFNIEPIYRGETLEEVVGKIAHKQMTEKEIWFLTQEIKFLNKEKMIDNEFKAGAKIEAPKYNPYNGGRSCSDMRNILVAVMKGKKYGVHWAYMIGVRSQENPSPSRDHYAYGVVCKKGTNLWTQAEWGAKILRRVTGSSAKNPGFGDIQRASRKYVGYECSDWVRNVWAVYNRCQGG